MCKLCSVGIPSRVLPEHAHPTWAPSRFPFPSALPSLGLSAGRVSVCPVPLFIWLISSTGRNRETFVELFIEEIFKDVQNRMTSIMNHLQQLSIHGQSCSICTPPPTASSSSDYLEGNPTYHTYHVICYYWYFTM